MNIKDSINILNGQEMLKYFEKHNLTENGIYIPFNEAMCVGEAASDIFSVEFVKQRCRAHDVSLEKYHEITLLPLKSLFENRFSNIILWFDDDMFCQINLLTILAYLSQINYTGKTVLNLVNREFKVVDSIELDLEGYSNLYEDIIIYKNMPQDIKLPSIQNGIKLYLEYLKEDNEITSYIRQHFDLQNDILVQELLKEFQQYGLGDTQYVQLIEKCRNHI